MSIPVQGQTTFATITGTVVDSSGAVVPKAVVTVTHIQTNYKYTAKANDTGDYTIPQLREGAYVLDAQAAGFQDFHLEGIVLAARDVRRIDVNLAVTAVSTSMQVTMARWLAGNVAITAAR